MNPLSLPIPSTFPILRSSSPIGAPLDLKAGSSSPRGPPVSVDQGDFYSQRLRQLAGASSPNAAIAAFSNLTASNGKPLPLDNARLPDPASPKPFAPKDATPTDLKLFSCTLCSFECEKESRLAKHIKSQHDSEIGRKDTVTSALSDGHSERSSCETVTDLSVEDRLVTPESKDVVKDDSGCISLVVKREQGISMKAPSLNNNPNGPKSTATDDVDTEPEDDMEDEADNELEEPDDELEEENLDDEEEQDSGLPLARHHFHRLNLKHKQGSSRCREGSAAPVNGDCVAQDLTVRGPISSSTTPVPQSLSPPKATPTAATATPAPAADPSAVAQMIAAASLRKSLLGEVMEKIGLTNIQQYSEAYKQALEERPNSAASFVNGIHLHPA